VKIFYVRSRPANAVCGIGLLAWVKLAPIPGRTPLFPPQYLAGFDGR
jgi:hypothetical protein